MAELGTRRTTERVRTGNSPPTAARAVFLPDQHHPPFLLHHHTGSTAALPLQSVRQNLLFHPQNTLLSAAQTPVFVRGSRPNVCPRSCDFDYGQDRTDGLGHSRPLARIGGDITTVAGSRASMTLPLLPCHLCRTAFDNRLMGSCKARLSEEALERMSALGRFLPVGNLNSR